MNFASSDHKNPAQTLSLLLSILIHVHNEPGMLLSMMKRHKSFLDMSSGMRKNGAISAYTIYYPISDHLE